MTGPPDVRCLPYLIVTAVLVLLPGTAHAQAEPFEGGTTPQTVASVSHVPSGAGTPSSHALGLRLRAGADGGVTVEDAFCRDRSATSLDVAGLAAVYCAEPHLIRGGLLAAHRSSYPVFYTAVPVAWLRAWMQGDGDYTDAYRLTLTQGVTYVTVVGLKRLIGRPRPYVTHPLTSRSEKYGTHTEDGAYASMPSGHASLSTALAVSWSLSNPQWYVVAPSALWAGTVTVSRLFLGVHYPSDVIAGAVLGAAVTVGVHLLRDAITPDGLRPDDPDTSPADALSNRSAPSVTLRFALP